MDTLSEKTLVMIIGPTAVGKSSLMNEVVKLDSAFARVSGFTTRPARADDEPGLYRYVSKETARHIIEQDDVVQFAIHPTTGDMYGTQPMDYPSQFNLLDTLSTVVNGMRALPFKNTVTISLAAEPAAWQSWVLSRYPNKDEDRDKRLEEARQSIEWSMAQNSGHYWLVNHPNDLKTTAEELIRTVRSGAGRIDLPPEAPELLDTAKSLLSYE
jgi:guanylate kinase